MGRKQINEENTMARFPAGTLARMKAVLNADEVQADFLRKAVERELRRRELRDVQYARARGRAG
jgi:hypothetical protein